MYITAASFSYHKCVRYSTKYIKPAKNYANTSPKNQQIFRYYFYHCAGFRPAPTAAAKGNGPTPTQGRSFRVSDPNPDGPVHNKKDPDTKLKKIYNIKKTLQVYEHMIRN